MTDAELQSGMSVALSGAVGLVTPGSGTRPASCPAIPAFPNFAGLGPEMMTAFEEHQRGFPPYSDFSLVNLISWDMDRLFGAALLDGSLVLRLQDYSTEVLCLTYLGSRNQTRTMRTLLEYAADSHIEPVLKFVPAHSVPHPESARSEGFSVWPDSASDDYIYSLERMTLLSDHSLAEKRQAVRRFVRENPAHEIQLLDLDRVEVRDALLEVHDIWYQQRGGKRTASARERVALERCLTAAPHKNVVAVGICLGERLVAFAINEQVHAGYCIGHFGKSIPSINCASDYVEHVAAHVQFERGYRFLNNQQDLGIPGLRAHKRSWKPCDFLRKLTICKSSV